MKNRIVALLSCVTLLLATSTVFADSFNPKIYQVYVDDDGLMTILGTGFPEGGRIQTLKVGGFPATDIIYDGVADSVQAQVPAQLGPGDYRLLVNFKLNNNAKNVTWDLSIGPQGPQGEQGKLGEPGAPGDSGDQGPQGKLGDKGEPGAPGDQGPQGKLGEQGEPGFPGKPGAQGNQGKLGAQGEQGKLGMTGAQGEQGKLGMTGAQGDQGKLGPAGPPGPVAAIGTSCPIGQFVQGIDDAGNLLCNIPVSCPCATLSGWDNTYQAAVCNIGVPTTQSITLATSFPMIGLFVHGSGWGQSNGETTCGKTNELLFGEPFVQEVINEQEAIACAAVLQQIAANDGVQCTAVP